MIIHITNVNVIYPYILEITFDDGHVGKVNLKKELYGPVFEPLRDPAFFAKVSVDANSQTVTWPNGADFAPDFLYELTKTAQAEPQPAYDR